MSRHTTTAAPAPAARRATISVKTIAAGPGVVHVPLANANEPAIIDSDAFDKLTAAGVSLCWTLNTAGDRQHRYVRAPASGVTGGLVTVARIVMDAGPGQIVRYRDGDPLNLTRSNLYLTSGSAKRTDSAAFRDPSETLQ